MSDFGLAREANFNLEGGKFPIKWTAPEAIKHKVGLIDLNYWQIRWFLYTSCLWVVVLGHFSFALVFVECSFFSIVDLLSNDKQQIKPHNAEH